jgi:type IX secretion system PorP/SprF family membrane protein
MMKKIFTLLLLVNVVLVNAQQLPVYTHLVANRFLINAATVGSVKQPSIDLLIRQQWLGMKASPQDATLSFQTYLPKYKIGLGAALFADKTAVLSRNTLNLAYSYRLPLKHKLNLAFGMNVSLSQFGINQSKIADALGNDDIVLQKNAHSFLADVGAGAFLFNNKWNVGLSSLQLAESCTSSS